MLTNVSALIRSRSLLGAVLLTSAALVSCGSGGSSGATHKPAASGSLPTKPSSPATPSATNEVLTSSELAAVEIPNTDLPDFEEVGSYTSDGEPSPGASPNPSDSDDSTGCSALDRLNDPGTRDAHEADVIYRLEDPSANKLVIVNETLISEPAAKLAMDLSTVMSAFARCRTFNFGDETPVKASVTSVSAPDGATGVRLQGNVSGHSIESYILFDKLRPTVGLLFAYASFGIGDPSKQAYSLAKQARETATLLLPS